MLQRKRAYYIIRFQLWAHGVGGSRVVSHDRAVVEGGSQSA
jgi:hypothetical protein